MDFEKLVPFIKKALASSDIDTADIQAILNEKNTPEEQEHQNPTVDGDITDISGTTQEESKNDEGKMIEKSFPELEVETAIETAKEEAKFKHIENDSTEKVATLWDLLQQKHCTPTVTG